MEKYVNFKQKYAIYAKKHTIYDKLPISGSFFIIIFSGKIYTFFFKHSQNWRKGGAVIWKKRNMQKMVILLYQNPTDVPCGKKIRSLVALVTQRLASSADMQIFAHRNP